MAAGRGRGHRRVATPADPCCLPSSRRQLTQAQPPRRGRLQGRGGEGGAARPCGGRARERPAERPVSRMRARPWGSTAGLCVQGCGSAGGSQGGRCLCPACGLGRGLQPSPASCVHPGPPIPSLCLPLPPPAGCGGRVWWNRLLDCFRLEGQGRALG